PLNFPVMILLSACAIKFRFRSLKKIVSYDRCREKISGFGLPQILSELLARDRRNESTGHVTLFFEKCGRSLTFLVTVPYKTCDERQFLLGFVRLSQVFPRTVTRFRTFVPDSPHCLLIAFSDPPRLASKSEEALRRSREGKEVPKRRKKVQKVHKTAVSRTVCRTEIALHFCRLSCRELYRVYNYTDLALHL